MLYHKNTILYLKTDITREFVLNKHECFAQKAKLYVFAQNIKNYFFAQNNNAYYY